MNKIVALFILLVLPLGVGAQISMPYFLSDHMVLQREKPIVVWGWAEPGISLTIELNGSIVEVTTNAEGSWEVYLPQMNAGGPYEMKISESDNNQNTKVFKDVMIGDVWFASGQSNMEWQVQQSDGAETEIPNSFNNNIRFCQIPHAVSLEPLENTQKTSWEVCDTSSVKDFSAVAYYFAKNIQPKIGVPVGIIQSTWGGTPVEAWTSKEMLQTNAFTRGLSQKNDTITYAHFQKDTVDINTFWDIVYNPKNNVDSLFSQPQYKDADWREVTVPGVVSEWENDFYEGMIWLRKTVDLKRDFTGTDLTINLGHPEMNYSVYFNGTGICKTQWNANLTHDYKVPASIIKKGENVIAIRIAALWGGGGLNRPAEDIYLSNGKKKISLAGNWTYKKDLEPSIPKVKYYHQYPYFIYNAMVHPIHPYGLKGFLWYQGENNEGEAYRYREMLPLMINDWRINWKQGNLPFVLVQLPNYMKTDDEPSDGKWAVLRESQTEALHLPNTAMTCIIDCGTGDNIHPTNKTVVGERLANVVAKSFYQMDLVASGPVFKDFSKEGNKLRIRFTGTAEGLLTKNNESVKGFAIAGEDHMFYWAEAIIEGSEVVISSDMVNRPIAVRYAWGNNPNCNLMNSAGLPALPFRTDDWQVVTQP
ncbi:sialate O-acetylesterase [Carboxylicivirga caseinilyticus]|uniref:sialate O-acetylesterase n=1 Tax=Carboxylicivirga caseinilyticus TaxID=3417572 RepID=UPI003D3489BA|nr:sialate O-acetylesterase [Marinilabiliaceae bacterium A049]